MPYAFIGLFSGFWKLALVAAVTLVLYGRSGLPTHPVLRLLRPYASTSRTRAQAQAPSRTPRRVGMAALSDRWFVFLLVTAASAVAAWVVTRMTVLGPTSTAP